MNWQFLLMSIFGLSIFFVVVATFLFYLQHRLARTLRRTEKAQPHPTEGRYFKRFLPRELKEPYDRRIQEHVSQQVIRHSILDYKWHAVVIVAALTIVSSFVRDHWYDFFKPLDLTESEYQLLDKSQHKIVTVPTERLPQLSKYKSALRERTFVLLGTPLEDRPDAPVTAIAAKARASWEAWLKDRGIRSLFCEQDKWDKCAGKADAKLIVVLPGEWQKDFLDGLLAKGEVLVLTGAPTQALVSGGSFEWRGLSLANSSRNDYPFMALIGDSALTLGFDPGQQLEVLPMVTNVRAKAARPDAVAIGQDRVLLGTVSARLTAIAEGDGRAVWMDFSPLASDHPVELNRSYFEALEASIFRYLLKESYSSIATWPGGKRFGAFIGFNMDDEHEHMGSVADLVKAEKFPLTWFLVSDFMQEERTLSRRLASLGEISCTSDSLDSLLHGNLTEQVRRLARCRKVLNQLTGRAPAGLHPPEEHFGDETLDSLINNKMKYILARTSFDRFVPLLKRAEGQRDPIVQLMRVTSDDYQLLSVLGLTAAETEERIFNEIAWVQTVGGLYSYNFSSRFMDSDDHRHLVSKVAGRLREAGAYFQTAAEISNWWIVREALIGGQTLDRDVLQKYSPKRLSVGPDGRMTEESL